MPVTTQSSLSPSPKGIILIQVVTTGHQLDRKDALVWKCQAGTLSSNPNTAIGATSHKLLNPSQTGTATSLSLSDKTQEHQSGIKKPLW